MGSGQRQLELFGAAPAMPAGFVYKPELISPEMERMLAECIAQLPLRPFDMKGYEGKRRVLSFGWRYDFATEELQAAETIPAFLLPLRERVGRLAGIAPDMFRQVLLTEYPPGAAIGWHRDRPAFGVVAGVSLLGPCRFRMRRKQASGWERVTQIMAPRSAYVLRGTARHAWEHSIPRVESLRYSITFRTLAR